MSKSIVSAAEHRQRIAESEKALELLKAERDRVASAIEQWEERAEERKAAAARAGAMESNLRRSKMNAAEKAKFIGEFGSASYFAIPW